MAKIMITFQILKITFGSLTQAVFWVLESICSVAGPEADWVYGAPPCSAFHVTDCISSARLYRQIVQAIPATLDNLLSSCAAQSDYLSPLTLQQKKPLMVIQETLRQ